MINFARNVNYRFRCGKVYPRCAACGIATLLNEDVERVPCITRDYRGHGDWRDWYKNHGYTLEESDDSGYKLMYQLIKCKTPDKEFYGAHILVSKDAQIIYDPTNYLSDDIINLDRDCHFSYYYDGVISSYVEKTHYFKVSK